MLDGLRHGQVLQPVAPHEGMVEPEPLGVTALRVEQANGEVKDMEDSTRGGKMMDVERGRGGKKKKVHGKGLTDGDDEMAEIPKNNLWLVMFSLGLVAFVASLDGTIVAAALPEITASLGATPSQYSWVGTSYLLAQTLMTPLTGRVSDIVGRKIFLYLSVAFLTVFSAVCGVSKSIEMVIRLIVARALAGVGGGSTVSLIVIVISDVVPMNQRGAFQGWFGAAWGISSVLGPILGGIITQKSSWRWCFYMNLPICGLAFILLFFSLNLPPPKGHTFAELRKTFDFLGLIMVMAGAALLIIGFATAADNGFGVPSAYGVIAAGLVVLIAVVIHSLTTKRNAIIPARMLRIRTTLFFLISSFLNSFMFFPTIYLLPQYFQGVRGSSSLQSGIDMVPTLVCASGVMIIAGQITQRFHIVRPLVWAGFFLTSLGFGLFYGLLTSTSSYAIQEIVQVIIGCGMGLSLSTPMLVIQAAMPLKDMAAATSAWVLCRSLAATVGLAVLTALLNTGLRTKFAKIDGYGTTFIAPSGAEGYTALHELTGETKVEVLSAFAAAFKPCWLIGCIALACALLLTIFTKSYSLDRSGGKAKPQIGVGETEEEKQVDEETKIGGHIGEETLVDMPGDVRDVGPESGLQSPPHAKANQ